MTTQEAYARAKKLGIEVDEVAIGSRGTFEYKFHGFGLDDQHAIDLLCAAIERWVFEKGVGLDEILTAKDGVSIMIDDPEGTLDSPYFNRPTKLEALIECAKAVSAAKEPA